MRLWWRLSSSSPFQLLISQSLEQQPLGRSLVAGMRLLLATSALAIIAIDPTEPNRLVTLTYVVLGAYVVYSAGVWVLSHGDRPYPRLFRITHWLDIGWYTVLVALSSGTNSLFFFGYLFAVLFASFRYGLREGLQVTFISTLLFAAAAVTAGPHDVFTLNRSALRPVYLLVLGYLMASFGHFEVTLRDRLQLLRDVSAVSNPRFGVDYTVGRLLDRIRDFYDAHLTLLIMQEGDTEEMRVRQSTNDRRATTASLDLPAPMRDRLMSLPENAAAIIGRHRNSAAAPLSITARDAATDEPVDLPLVACEAILTTLDATTVATVPVIQHARVLGRVFVVSRRRDYHLSDLDLLIQVFKQMIPVIENIRLLDRLASEAAGRERRRIAHDIHDSVIQSYVGIQLALRGARRRADEGVLVVRDLDQIDRLVEEEIAAARQFVSALQLSVMTTSTMRSLLDRVIRKFAAAAAMTVDVEVADNVQVTDRLAAEVLPIVEEALSNVRRHTESARAGVRMSQTAQWLTLEVRNDLIRGESPLMFVPKSLSLRAGALGGRVTVEPRRGEATRVFVEIPL